MALEIKLTKTPYKYLQALDRSTRERIREKLQAIAENPQDARLSKPLTNSSKRSARVGTYRILFETDEKSLIVAEIGPRGQVYRKA